MSATTKQNSCPHLYFSVSYMQKKWVEVFDFDLLHLLDLGIVVLTSQLCPLMTRRTAVVIYE